MRKVDQILGCCRLPRSFMRHGSSSSNACGDHLARGRARTRGHPESFASEPWVGSPSGGGEGSRTTRRPASRPLFRSAYRTILGRAAVDRTHPSHRKFGVAALTGGTSDEQGPVTAAVTTTSESAPTTTAPRTTATSRTTTPAPTTTSLAPDSTTTVPALAPAAPRTTTTAFHTRRPREHMKIPRVKDLIWSLTRGFGGAAGNRTRVLRRLAKASPCAVRYVSTWISRSREQAVMTIPVTVGCPIRLRDRAGR